MTFTAPTTYTEAKALMGTDVDTPIGTLHCDGAGLTGVAGTPTEQFSITFHNSEGRVAILLISWDSVDGWVTGEESKARTWTECWDRLPSNARTLIDLILGEALKAYPLHKRSKVDKLLRIAKRRLIKTGKLALKTCGRCGGSGKYSYTPMEGDTCRGCGGTGVVLPTTSEALRAARK